MQIFTKQILVIQCHSQNKNFQSKKMVKKIVFLNKIVNSLKSFKGFSFHI